MIERGSNHDKVGIAVYEMTWETYLDTIIQSQEQLQVDMILTDPPYCLPTSRTPTGEGYNDQIDEREMDMFSQFARRVIVPGGFWGLFTSYHLFVKLKRDFEDRNFVFSNAPFVLVKRTGMLQKSSSPRYPQNGYEFALVSRQRGDHPQGFQPRFSEQYRLIKYAHSRRFSIIDFIPPVRRKLKYPGTNRPIRTEEKSNLMIAEIMTTFCPEGGTVLEAYGGTLTTALACIATGRKCIATKKMADCF